MIQGSERFLHINSIRSKREVDIQSLLSYLSQIKLIRDNDQNIKGGKKLRQLEPGAISIQL